MKIENLVKSPNIAQDMDDEELSALGARLLEEVNMDLTSRADWEEREMKNLLSWHYRL